MHRTAASLAAGKPIHRRRTAGPSRHEPFSGETLSILQYPRAGEKTGAVYHSETTTR